MKKSTLTIITLLVVSGLILSACGSSGTTTSLKGTSWTLISYGSTGNQTPVAPGIGTSLIFGTDGQVNGNLGCNSFGENYEVNNGKIVFSQMISTMMACQEPQMTQETTSFQVMTGTVNFKLEGNTLTIYDASGAMAITLSMVPSK